jgi:hypothetical protein
MANYVDASTQTIWAGLTRGDIVRPEFLFTAPDTTTPPDDMLTGKRESTDMLPSAIQPFPPASSGSSLLDRRLNRPNLFSRISLPNSQLDDEVLPSPPPTQAILSPVPAANKLHAGHTPLFPGSMSPATSEEQQVEEAPPDEEDQSATPQQDKALQGPLILPTNPVDGADDHNIALDVLDDVLSKVAQEQERFSKLKHAPEPSTKQDTLEDGMPLSRKGSADSRRSDGQTVDGVILKSPPLNFGAPLGQA